MESIQEAFEKAGIDPAGEPPVSLPDTWDPVGEDEMEP